MTRNGTLDHDKILFSYYFNDFHIADCYPAIAMVTCHLDALENPGGLGALTDGAAAAEAFVHTVALLESGKVMAFHNAGKTTSLGIAGNAYQVFRGEHGGIHDVAFFIIF